MSEYAIWLCPFCQEQIETDDYEPYGHEHDGVRYSPLRVTVEWTVPAAEIQEAVERAQQEHQEAERKRAEDQAEIDRMEAEWRASAPAEQVKKYEAFRAKELRGLANMSAVLKDVFAGPTMREMMADADRESKALFFGTPEDKAKATRITRENARRRLQETIALFDAEGPSRVPFRKLRDAQRKLAEMDAS